MIFDKLLTVVIPCKNEGMTLVKTLRSLDKSYGIYNKLRVIIADVSDDNGYTERCINEDKFNNIGVEMVRGGLPAVGRNNGAKLVTTKYVLFLDADIFLFNECILMDMVLKMERDNLHLGTVKFRTEFGDYDYVYKCFDVIQGFTKKKNPFAVGGFMLFDTDEFNHLGGFNEEDKFAEDYHLSSRIDPTRFYIDKYHTAYTTSRRFVNKGLWYMVKMMVKSYLNRNNPEFFKKDHNYWN